MRLSPVAVHARRKLAELQSVQDAYGGLAIDWRQRRRLEKELAALQRMVATGARLAGDEAAEKGRLAALKQARRRRGVRA